MKIGYEAKRVFHNKTGLGNYSRDLVRILSTYFPENKYFLYNPKTNNKPLFQANEQIVFEKNPTTSFYKKFYNIWRQKGILKDLKRDEITLFHGLSGEIPSGLKQNKIKSIVTIHDLIFVRYPNLYSYWDRKIHFYKFKKAAKQADLVIAISEQTKTDIIKFLGIEASKIKVIYQGCQAVFKEEYLDTEKDAVSDKYNLPSNFILNVGTIEERKNAFTIVQAIKDIDTHLVLIGKETAYSNLIKDYIKENKIEHKVTFLKGISSKELAIIYQLASVFVYPSVFEGFGIPIIEALFSKTPVITTNSGVFPEAGGPDSIYINPDDVQALTENILLLLSNESLRAVIVQKGHLYAQKFQDKEIANQLMQTYKMVYNG